MRGAEVIRITTTSILTQHGYRVLAAADGLEGVELFALRAAEISLVVVDFNMPHLDGGAFAAAARRLNPTVPLLFVSGMAGACSPELLAQPRTALLAKPFDVDQLLTGVHQLMQRLA